MRNARSIGGMDFLFGGPRLMPVTDGSLSDFYVTGSPQAGGRRATRTNEKRTRCEWAAKAAMVGAALAAAEAEGTEPTRDYVVSWCAANHTEYGVNGTSQKTMEKRFQPSFDKMPFVMAEDKCTIVPVDG